MNKKKISILALLLGTTVLLTSCAGLGRAIIGGETTTKQIETTTTIAMVETTTSAPSTTTVESTPETTIAVETSETTTAPATKTPMVPTTPHVVTATLPANWIQVTDVETLATFFSDAVTDPERYAFTAESDTVYMYVYAMKTTPTWDVITKLADEYKAEVATEGVEQTKQNYLDRFFTEGEIANFAALANGEVFDAAKQALVLEENYLRNWLYGLSSEDPNTQLLNFEYRNISGKSIPVATYTNFNLTEVKGVNIIDDQLYLIVAWSTTANFETSKADIDAVFNTVTFTKR